MSVCQRCGRSLSPGPCKACLQEMTAPVLKIESFRKAVPTDMHWGGTFRGGYCIAAVWQQRGAAKAMVHVYGTDDTSLVRFFSSWEEALTAYNSITYVQSLKDLEPLFDDRLVPDTNHNGWPCERARFTGAFTFPEENEDATYDDGTEVELGFRL